MPIKTDREGLDGIRRKLPFELAGIDSNHGSEFINDHLVRYCKREALRASARVEGGSTNGGGLGLAQAPVSRAAPTGDSIREAVALFARCRRRNVKRCGRWAALRSSGPRAGACPGGDDEILRGCSRDWRDDARWGGAAPAAERRDHPRGRSRLRRPRLSGAPDHPHAAPRSPGRAGETVHRLLRRGAALHAEPRGAPDRALRDPQRHVWEARRPLSGIEGLPAEEITLAELLHGRGYATAHIGKWHLGVHPGSTPNDQGFDLSYGLPYSNDMDPEDALPEGASGWPHPPVDGWNVPLILNGKVIERPVDQRTLTERYTAKAVEFVAENRDRPFFLYFAHTFPHVPLFASPQFRGESPRGIYGDTIEELDWSVGEVIAALRAAGVAENTFVFFTSDNGPWLTMGLQGGSAGVLRDGKGSTWEGGMREPAIAWWPGHVSPGIVHDPVSTMDLFATGAALAGAPVPADRTIDGIDLAPALFHDRPLPKRPFFCYRGDQLAACRLGWFKLHFSTQDGFSPLPPERRDPPLLFDLGRDPGEQVDVAAAHSDVVARIEAAVRAHQAATKAGPPQFD